MGWLINLIAVIVSLVSVAIVLGHDGYLALLSNAAKKRAGGKPVGDWVKSRVPVAAGTSIGAVLAALMTTGGVGMDIVAILLGAGSGAVAYQALETTRKRYATRK